MSKAVELRRHTANDGDELTPEGIAAAVEIGRHLSGTYDAIVSSGAQRATQTIACFLAGVGVGQPDGVLIDHGFRSHQEERWFAIAKLSGGGGFETFLDADPEFVRGECELLAGALRRVMDGLPEGGRALVVGHSPMHEAAVYGLTGVVVRAISKGAGVLVVAEGDGYRVEPID